MLFWQSYYKALKKQENAGIVEAAQVDEMFYQIPEILLCHEFFLQQLQARVNEWHDKQKIGDIFVSSVSHCQDKPTMTALSEVTTFYFNTSVTPSCQFMCQFFCSYTFWHIAEQTHSNMEPIC